MRSRGWRGGAPLTCCEVVELLTAHLEGALAAASAADVRAHLVRCPGCATYLQQLGETSRVLGDLCLPTLPAQSRLDLLAVFRGRHRA